ncbi:MAG: PrsW family glutamic-type intramembrane protease [Haliscomenobacter sp.]|uniref:PrsW family glutamic-type intramembrane protease n=1 Tax=Haliscomenobacter sp. TaxID=2717303 RepID=UPI0029B21A6A|nr:PrsW family glutamic-type intramembrane protease [Haliscomenobacter sp.]MDX2068999.1 PrsW family glutamic-type intramembrane protease [Haliscomenobacter sp.]
MSLLIASITPVMIFMYLVYRKDKLREPRSLLLKCFFGGFLALVLTLIITGPIAPIAESIGSPFWKAFYDAFCLAAIPEEFSKLLILYWVIWRNKHFDQYYDGILYAIFVSLGFALVENILYVLDGGMGVAIARAILAVPGHGFFAVLMGYYFALAKFHRGGQKNRLLLASLGMPILFHGLYDFALMYSEAEELDEFLILGILIFFTLVVIQLWRLGFKKIKAHLKRDHLIADEMV